MPTCALRFRATPSSRYKSFGRTVQLTAFAAPCRHERPIGAGTRVDAALNTRDLEALLNIRDLEALHNIRDLAGGAAQRSTDHRRSRTTYPDRA